MQATKQRVRDGEGGDLSATYSRTSGISPAVLAQQIIGIDDVVVLGGADPQEIANYDEMLRIMRADREAGNGSGAPKADVQHRDM